MDTCFLKQGFSSGCQSKGGKANINLASNYEKQYQQILQLLQQSQLQATPSSNSIISQPTTINSTFASSIGKVSAFWVINTKATNHTTCSI
ncbi:hypothetical protein CR513_26447, partial [Mucuna pruriens]